MGKYVPGMTERQKTLITQVSDYAEGLDGYRDKLKNFVPNNDYEREKLDEIKKDSGVGELEVIDAKYEKVYVTDPMSGREIYVGDRKFVALKDGNGNICISCYGTDKYDLNDYTDDLISTLFKESPDAKAARDFYDRVRSRYPKADISLFGHSHGGFLCASIIKYHEDEIKSAFFYNAQIPDHDLPWHKIESVRVMGEMLVDGVAGLLGFLDIHDRRTNQPEGIDGSDALHGWNNANYGPDGYMGTESIRVETDKLKQWSGDLNYIHDRYSSIIANLDNVLDANVNDPITSISPLVSSKGTIKFCSTSAKESIKNCSLFLKNIADLLEQCETEIFNYF